MLNHRRGERREERGERRGERREERRKRRGEEWEVRGREGEGRGRGEEVLDQWMLLVRPSLSSSSLLCLSLRAELFVCIFLFIQLGLR